VLGRDGFGNVVEGTGIGIGRRLDGNERLLVHKKVLITISRMKGKRVKGKDEKKTRSIRAITSFSSDRKHHFLLSPTQLGTGEIAPGSTGC
jgi:hypothetical protein